MKEEIIEKSEEWIKKAERDLQVARILRKNGNWRALS